MDGYRTLIKTIKDHRELNYKIENFNKALSKMRKIRCELEENMLREISRLNLSNKKLRIDNSHYFIGISKTTPNLNIGLIEIVGNDFLGENTTKGFLEKIKEYRQSNVVREPSIKCRQIRKARSIKSKIPIKKDKSLKRKID
jgi:uncharacterized pyridoxal phosphate-containing UPF0001 family protein